MKATVKMTFKDKKLGVYRQAGEIIEVADSTRLKELENRGLVEAVAEEKPKPTRKRA